MRTGEPEHTIPALLLHKYEQARSEVVIAERQRPSVRTPPPEGNKCARLGRGVSCGSDMPGPTAELHDS